MSHMIVHNNNGSRERHFFLIVFRTTCASACGDSFSVCGGSSLHAEIGVPCADNLASMYNYYTPMQKAAL